jgi:hypothetical protein
MAQIATLTQPYTADTVEVIRGIPVAPLSMPFTFSGPVSGIASTISNRFPVPPTAAAFLTLVDALEYEPFALDLVFGNPIIAALTPESVYLEPTIGQIWPR